MQAKPQPQEGVTAGKLTFTSEPINFFHFSNKYMPIASLHTAHANPI